MKKLLLLLCVCFSICAMTEEKLRKLKDCLASLEKIEKISNTATAIDSLLSSYEIIVGQVECKKGEKITEYRAILYNGQEFVGYKFPTCEKKFNYSILLNTKKQISEGVFEPISTQFITVHEKTCYEWLEGLHLRFSVEK